LNYEPIENKRKSNKDKIEFYTADCSPYGITYGAWTTRWWKWCFSIEKNRNPVIDETGKFCAEGQEGNVWFLAGKWVSDERNYPHRKCSVPSDVSILFPLINCEENLLEYPSLKTHKSMIAKLSKDMDTVRHLKCFVDGEDLPPQLVRSDPTLFSITIRGDISAAAGRAENEKGGKTIMTSSGYWVFLKPLPKGKHHISLEGSYQHGKLHSGAVYDISVI
jgi:hypothetical protein